MKASTKRALTVVITGASAGLGRAIAQEFGKAGARVGLISRVQAALDAAAAGVEQLGGTAATYVVDVSNDQAVEKAAASFEEHLGPIDVWVNNAMVSVFSPIKEMEPAEFRRVTEVNYLGYVHGTLGPLGGCCREIMAGSFRLVRRSLSGAYRCSQLTAPPNMPSSDSPTRCDVNLFMTKAV